MICCVVLAAYMAYCPYKGAQPKDIGCALLYAEDGMASVGCRSPIQRLSNRAEWANQPVFDSTFPPALKTEFALLQYL